MAVFRSSVATIIVALITSAHAFAPLAPIPRVSSETASSLNALPGVTESIQPLIDSSDILLSKFSPDKIGELTKSIFIVLLFGGGLIPASIAANKSLIGTLKGKRAGGDDGVIYVEDSGAAGPALQGQALLFASEKIPLVDIIAIIGRIQDYNSIADWRNLKTTEQAANVMWLPRKEFKENIRNAKFIGWPVDPKTGGEHI